MKKFIIYSIILFISSLLIISCGDCFSDYRQFKKERLYDVIINAHLNEDNHMTPLFILGNNRKKWLHGLEDLCNNASSGDTLKKDSNSLDFYLIKQDTVLVFNPKCNGSYIYK